MARTLEADDPHLRAAIARLRRVQWTWAALAAVLAGMYWVSAWRDPLAPPPVVASAAWLALAVSLAWSPQPALLGVVAAAWAVSIVLLIPGLATAIQPDPLAVLLGGSTVESVGIAIVRLILAVMAWNQFLFYRMLYGTALATGLPPGLPAIPELVRNRSDRFAILARLAGVSAVVLAWASLPTATGLAGAYLLEAAWWTGLGAIGAGLGAAFSPTRRRGAALTGLVAGLVAPISTMLAARLGGP